MFIISKIVVFASEISTDLDSGRRPKLKSVELSFLPNVVHELQSILYVKLLKKVKRGAGVAAVGVQTTQILDSESQ